jgi:VWA domain-containing protein
MTKRFGWLCIFALCLVTAVRAGQVVVSTKPLRIVLLVDSSSEVSALINPFRAGLKAFLEGAPEDAEIALITTGGQIRIRQQPTSDHEKLLKAMSNFAPDGGANAFLDTLLESDQRFLKKAPDRLPVFVILTTDNGAGRGEPRIDDYNKFMNDFLQRRGQAYAIVVRTGGGGMSATSDIINNLIGNTRGTYDPINSANAVPDKMKAIAARLAALP